MTGSAAVTSQIYDGVTGESNERFNGALRIARLIEEELISGRWPAGTVYGSQQQMLERYSVGRGVLREALRVLQRRGWASVRRGPGGGMIVSIPATDDIIESAISYLVMAGTTPIQLREARLHTIHIAATLAARCRDVAYMKSLREAAEATSGKSGRELHQCYSSFCRTMANLPGNPAMSLFVSSLERFFAVSSTFISGHELACSDVEARVLFASVTEAIESGDEDASAAMAKRLIGKLDRCYDTTIHVELLHFKDEPVTGNTVPGLLPGNTRANQVARQLIGDMRSATLQSGERIGSEAELSRRYGVDRLVARQAIRILEDFGVVRPQRGRGRGLLAQTPMPGPTIRLVSGYFSGTDQTLYAALESMQLLSLSMVKLAAQKCTDDDAERIELVLKDLEQWPGPPELVPLNDAESEPFRIAGNPILSLFSRSLQIFCLRAEAKSMHFPDTYLAGYRQKSAAVLSAIRDREPQAALMAQHEKHLFFRGHIDGGVR